MTFIFSGSHFENEPISDVDADIYQNKTDVRGGDALALIVPISTVSTSISLFVGFFY